MIISHAFRGFIYLPLYLAEGEGFLPKGAQLEYADGDEAALRRLLVPQGGTRADFALCDPLMVGAELDKIAAEVGYGKLDPPIIVGSLIQKTPLWLFNPTPRLRPVRSEEELLDSIETIRCYEKPNTGWVVACRLKKLLTKGAHSPNLAQVNFEGEFDSPIEEDEVVATSNVLRMAEVGFDDRQIIFSYARNRTEIQGMFFTGVLTRRSIFEGDLPRVLTVLNGLKKAVWKVVDKNNDPDQLVERVYLVEKDRLLLTRELEATSEDEVKAILKRAIVELIHKEEIYSETLEISQAAWQANIQLRSSVIPGWEAPEFEKYTHDIPVILLQPTWPSTVTVKAGEEAEAEGADLKEAAEPNIPERLRSWAPAGTLLASLLSLGFILQTGYRFRSVIEKNLDLTPLFLLTVSFLVLASVVSVSLQVVFLRQQKALEAHLYRVWVVLMAVAAAFAGLYYTRLPPADSVPTIIPAHEEATGQTPAEAQKSSSDGAEAGTEGEGG